MTRKFLLCFPLRSGNIVFGFIVVCISLAVVIFHFYRLALTVVAKDEDLEDRFRNFAQLETIFGNDSEKNDLVVMVTIFYYLSYIIVGMLLLIFATMLTCGACKVDKCLVTTFFVYSFFHMFLTAGLIAWEILTSGWLQLGLILASNLLLIVCLFSVKYLMEAINTGNIYTQPEAVTYYRY